MNTITNATETQTEPPDGARAFFVATETERDAGAIMNLLDALKIVADSMAEKCGEDDYAANAVCALENELRWHGHDVFAAFKEIQKLTAGYSEEKAPQ